MITGLTKSQIDNIIEFIELNFIPSIRVDTEIDNIDYVVDMMSALTTLRETSKQMSDDSNMHPACKEDL